MISPICTIDSLRLKRDQATATSAMRWPSGAIIADRLEKVRMTLHNRRFGGCQTVHVEFQSIAGSSALAATE
jgi:hypothetical protein